jgi:hypothetical protein
MSTTLRRLLATTVLLGAGTAAALAPTVAVSAHDRTTAAAGPARDAARADVAELRRVLAPYRDQSAASAAGYRPSGACAALPDGGGMGVHWISGERMAAPPDPARPPILLYGTDGSLLGAEFFVPDADQDLTTDGDRPSLFGRPFDGPMPGHEPGMPVHYDLHVWTHEANPDGVFAPWNPRVSC